MYNTVKMKVLYIVYMIFSLGLTKFMLLRHKH